MPSDTVIVLGRDATGYLVAENTETMSDGRVWSMRYYLTDCCLASAKGCDGYIGCRACYQEIDDLLGGEPMALTETFGDGLPYDTYKAKRERGEIA